MNSLEVERVKMVAMLKMTPKLKSLCAFDYIMETKVQALFASIANLIEI